MSVFGIGPLEMLAIAVVALLVFGPEEMVTKARQIGRWIRKLRQHSVWQTMHRASWEFQRWKADMWGHYNIQYNPTRQSTWWPQAPWNDRYPTSHTALPSQSSHPKGDAPCPSPDQPPKTPHA